MHKHHKNPKRDSEKWEETQNQLICKGSLITRVFTFLQQIPLSLQGSHF